LRASSFLEGFSRRTPLPDQGKLDGESAMNSAIQKLGIGSLLALSAAMPASAQQQAAAQPVTLLDQAWSQEDREWYYNFSQGSAIIWYDVFLNLEVAGSEELFRSDANSVRFGLIPQAANPRTNPDAFPVGVTKNVVTEGRWKGETVGPNCAVCHTATYRSSSDEAPVFITAGNGHTTNVEAFFRYLVDCARDPRFNADNLMREINLVTDLSWFDRLSYRFLIIPITKKRLLEREAQFKWVYRKDFPDWGRGRDDAMNLTKYFMIKVPMDDTFGPTDMPSIWNLKKYNHEKNMRMNWAGDSHDARSVIIDSALGLLGAPPHDKDEFLAQVDWLYDYLTRKPAPKYPFPIDKVRVAAGEVVFDRTCAGCHASDKTGTRIPLAEVGTEKDRLDSWNKQAAIEANRIVKEMGIERPGLVEEDLNGYDVPFLDGIWLRAPYLHNGSVPTLRDLLTPPGERTKVFWRGYDVYDPVNVGFVMEGAEAERVGTKHDTALRGGRNMGHVFGTNLSAEDKDTLIEYLKTL